MHHCQYSHACTISCQRPWLLFSRTCWLSMSTCQAPSSCQRWLTDHLCDLCPVFPVYFAFSNFDQIPTHPHIKYRHSSCVRIEMLSASDESLTDKSEWFFLGLQVWVMSVWWVFDWQLGWMMTLLSMTPVIVSPTAVLSIRFKISGQRSVSSN